MVNDKQTFLDISRFSYFAVFSIPCVDATTLGNCVSDIYNWSLYTVGIVAFVQIFFAGVIYLTAAGDTGRISQAKEKIKKAILGIILLFSSYLILYTINPDLVGGTFTLPEFTQTTDVVDYTGGGVEEPPPPPVYECNDNIDNDKDDYADYPYDTGCTSPEDNSESKPGIQYQCSDTKDNDNDGKTDYPADNGCTSATDNDESSSGSTPTPVPPPQCSITEPCSASDTVCVRGVCIIPQCETPDDCPADRPICQDRICISSGGGGQDCGNGTKEGTEGCDNGPASNGVCPATCSSSCTLNTCNGGGGNPLHGPIGQLAGGTQINVLEGSEGYYAVVSFFYTETSDNMRCDSNIQVSVNPTIAEFSTIFSTANCRQQDHHFDIMLESLSFNDFKKYRNTPLIVSFQQGSLTQSLPITFNAPDTVGCPYVKNPICGANAPHFSQTICGSTTYYCLNVGSGWRYLSIQPACSHFNPCAKAEYPTSYGLETSYCYNNQWTFQSQLPSGICGQ